MEAVARWECEHGYTVAHYQEDDRGGSRTHICGPVEVKMIGWCGACDRPLADCGHQSKGIWRKGIG
jgi:hypothetical protein